MLDDPNLLERIADHVETLGVAGERNLCMLLYLVATSRILARPLAAIVRGDSSSGKSFIVQQVTSLLPEQEAFNVTAMTPKALFYAGEGGLNLTNKLVTCGERSRDLRPEAAEFTRALRQLISDGVLEYMVAQASPNGGHQTRRITVRGPIAYLETTTLPRTKIFEEDANRCLILETDNSPEQTRRIMLHKAVRSLVTPIDVKHIQAVHRELQLLVQSAAERPVHIPFLERLARLMPVHHTSLRRGFDSLVTTIQTSVLLHHRQRNQDTAGNWIATQTDYEIARRLLQGPLTAQVGATISSEHQDLYKRLRQQFTISKRAFSVREVSDLMEKNRNTARDQLGRLVDAGLLRKMQRGSGPKPDAFAFTDAKLDELGRIPIRLPAPAELTDAPGDELELAGRAAHVRSPCRKPS